MNGPNYGPRAMGTKKDDRLSSNNFKKSGYKPTTPFTTDQLAYLEDKLTSIGMKFWYLSQQCKKMSKRIDEDLNEIKELYAHRPD